MKRYKTLFDIIIDNKDTIKIDVIPKGTILTEWGDGKTYEIKKPVMSIGCSWVENNPNVFKEI